MRLLIVVTGARRGGAENYALTIARAAVQQGWRVDVAIAPLASLATLAHDLQEAGAHLAPVDCTAGLRGRRPVVGVRLARQAAAVGALLRTRRPDAVHVVSTWPDRGLGAMIACAVRGTPALVVHQLIAGVHPLGRPWATLHRLARRRGQRLVAVSAHNRRLLAESFGMPADRIALIHNGTDAPPALAGPERAEARAALRAELAAPAAAEVVLGVGRLSPEKGFDVLIEAFAGLPASRPGRRLVLAGDGDEAGRLQRLAAARGCADRVHLLGWRSDVPRLLAAADVFAFPSRAEGWPFALLEAMAVGVPVVASDAPVMRELTEDGDCAALFGTGDPGSLRDALQATLGAPAEAASRAERGRLVAGRFTSRRMQDETLAALAALRS